MTIWQPQIDRFPGPRYRAIAEALAADLREGRLKPGDRLPTHRDLAWHLQVTVGTVSRAYAEAARRGLTSGEVGRGTFVRDPAATERPAMERFVLERASPKFQPTGDLPVNLAQGHPIPGAESHLLSAALHDLADGADLDQLLSYQPHNGRPDDRAAAADWLMSGGVPAEAGRLVITGGAQHSIATILSGLTAPGDVVATEAMTYPGFKVAAQLHHLRVEGIAVDQEGLLPDAFAAACRAAPIRLLYCTPNLSNPLAGVLSAERRRPLRVAIVGEFNAGKSTFINALLEAELFAASARPTTGAAAGATRIGRMRMRPSLARCAGG